MLQFLRNYRILLIFLPVFFLFVLLEKGFCADFTKGSAYRLGSKDVVNISILAGGEEQVTKEIILKPM